MNHEENKTTSLNTNNKTFNKICRIQKFIKKESAMKNKKSYYRII